MTNLSHKLAIYAFFYNVKIVHFYRIRVVEWHCLVWIRRRVVQCGMERAGIGYGVACGVVGIVIFHALQISEWCGY